MFAPLLGLPPPPGYANIQRIHRNIILSYIITNEYLQRLIKIMGPTSNALIYPQRYIYIYMYIYLYIFSSARRPKCRVAAAADAAAASKPPLLLPGQNPALLGRLRSRRSPLR